MSKNISAPLLRTARLLDLVPYLNTHQGIALKDLARHFDVTPAQMTSDLTTLWMCGLPGYTPLELMDIEFESGFVSISNASTLAKPRSITFQEAVVFMLGLDLIAALLPEDRVDLLAATDSLQKRIAPLLGVPIKLSVVTQTSGTVATAIALARETNVGLQIQYHSMYRDQISERLIMPLDVYHNNNHEYLKAFCYSVRDYREFRVDRIIAAKPTTVVKNFERESRDSQKIEYTITILQPTRDVAERFAIRDIVNGSAIDLTSYSRQWIERSVLAAGGSVELVSPMEIRAEIAKKAQLMLNRYIGA